MKYAEIITELDGRNFDSDVDFYDAQRERDRRADPEGTMDRERDSRKAENTSAEAITEEWLMNLHADDIEAFAESVQADVPGEQPSASWKQYGEQLDQFVADIDGDADHVGFDDADFKQYDADDFKIYQLLDANKMVKWSMLKKHFDDGQALLRGGV